MGDGIDVYSTLKWLQKVNVEQEQEKEGDQSGERFRRVCLLVFVHAFAKTQENFHL